MRNSQTDWWAYRIQYPDGVKRPFKLFCVVAEALQRTVPNVTAFLEVKLKTTIDECDYGQAVLNTFLRGEALRAAQAEILRML